MLMHEERVNFLHDQIRRAIANPGNARKVAEAIAKDWNPAIIVDRQGKPLFVEFIKE